MERRVPPQSIESEMSVLGSVFINEQSLGKITGIIDAADFYRESHRMIFQTFLSLSIQKQPIDLVTVTQRLKADGSLEECGGGAYLATLVDYVPTSANVAHYCKVVKDASVRRQIIMESEKLISHAYSHEPISEGVSDTKKELTRLESSFDSFGGVSVNDITTLDQRATAYTKSVRTLQDRRFITGFDLLDSKIRGVAPGEVMTIIAEPGGFKTAWLQNLLLRGAKRTGKYHLFFSLEMPGDKVFEREAQIASGCTGWDVERSYKDMGSHAEDIHASMYDSGSLGLLVCDKPRLSIEKISRYCDLAAHKYGPVNAIGIDYLGLMHAPGRTLFEKVSFLAPELKNLAKELSLPVIVLCQINREGAKVKHGIEITDAKGGGDIEASADIMLGFYRDAEDNLVCKGLKNRNGSTGWKLHVELNREAFQFIDMCHYNDPKKVRGGIDY